MSFVKAFSEKDSIVFEFGFYQGRWVVKPKIQTVKGISVLRPIIDHIPIGINKVLEDSPFAFGINLIIGFVLVFKSDQLVNVILG